MAEYNELVEALRYLIFERLQKKGQFVHGLLGDGRGRVSVPGRPDFSYARPGRQTTAVFEVFNKEVAGPDGWPVLIGELPWQAGLTQVVGTDWEAYTDAGWAMNSSLVGPHARQHEWPDTAPGTDPVNVYRRALAEMKTIAVGSGSFGVQVSPYDYDYGVPKSWPGSPGLDLAAAVPATGTSRLMLTYLDPVSNAIGLVTGSLGVHSDAVELPRPTLPTGAWFPSAYVQLYGGQASILERDIRDARRMFCGGIATGTFPIGPAGGDLTGTYPNPQVAGLFGYPLADTAPAAGQVLMYTGSIWRPVYPSTLAAPDGSPNPALAIDSDGDAILYGPNLRGQASAFPNIGSTILAEKLGHVYLALDKDIYPDNDIYGPWSRLINLGLNPDEHWHQNADMLIWAGWAAYTGFATPNFVGRGSSALYAAHNAANRAFYYRAANTAANIFLRARVATFGGINCLVGLMVDDGVDNADGNGADNYYRVVLEWATSLSSNLNLRREYRVGGGAPVAAATAFSLPPVAFYGIGLQAAMNAGAWNSWTGVGYIRGESAVDSYFAFDNLPFTWTPARVGIYIYQQYANLWGVWDWYDEAAS